MSLWGKVTNGTTVFTSLTVDTETGPQRLDISGIACRVDETHAWIAVSSTVSALIGPERVTQFVSKNLEGEKLDCCLICVPLSNIVLDKPATWKKFIDFSEILGQKPEVAETMKVGYSLQAPDLGSISDSSDAKVKELEAQIARIKGRKGQKPAKGTVISDSSDEEYYEAPEPDSLAAARMLGLPAESMKSLIQLLGGSPPTETVQP